MFNQLRDIFQDADVDGSGTLSFEEVRTAINKPEIYNKLRMIDFPVDNPEQVFDMLDYDESGELTIEEFITGCLRMKGPAQSKDLLVAQVALDCVKKQYVIFEQELEVLQAKLGRLDATARALTDHGERVFLDMRQYRMRHPDERGSDIPRMGSVVMKKAPWESPLADRNDESALAPYMPAKPEGHAPALSIGNEGTPFGVQTLGALQDALLPGRPSPNRETRLALANTPVTQRLSKNANEDL